MKRDFVSLTDITAAEFAQLLSLAADLKQSQKSGESTPLLRGKTLALLFHKPSLRLPEGCFEPGYFEGA